MAPNMTLLTGVHARTTVARFGDRREARSAADGRAARWAPRSVQKLGWVRVVGDRLNFDGVSIVYKPIDSDGK